MKKWLTALLLSLLISLLSFVTSCSDFLLNTSSVYDAASEVVSARTMDFTVDLQTVLEVIPRGTTFHDPPPLACRECADFQWTNKYGFVALNLLGINFAADGMNEQGLSVAWLYLDGTTYPVPDPTVRTKPIVTSTCSYLMGNFATVGEVREALTHLIQVGEFDVRMEAMFPSDGATALGRIPLHMSIHDAHGDNLVIEYINGTIKMYDNLNDVLTNDPPLDQQLDALQAHGFRDIPGGYSPTERFIRLSVLNHAVDALAYPPDTTYANGTQEQQVISAAVHILQTVVEPIGEPTQWSLVRDHKRGKLYFQSTQNLVLRVIDLNKLEFEDAASRRAIPVTFGNWFVDVTEALLDPSNHLKTKDLPSRETIEAILANVENTLHQNSTMNLAATASTQPAAKLDALITSSAVATVSLFVAGFGSGVGAMLLLHFISRRGRRHGYANVDSQP